MPQKVLRCFKAGITERETSKLIIGTLPPIEVLPTLSPRSKFNLVPTTPSRLDLVILQSANETLFNNIKKGILDTPTRTYIPKVIKVYDQIRTTCTLA